MMMMIMIVIIIIIIITVCRKHRPDISVMADWEQDTKLLIYCRKQQQQQ